MSSNLLFLALIPGIIIIIYIFRKDKVEHEPWSLLFKLVAFGALSCLPAMFLETGMNSLAPGLQQGTMEFAFYEAFLVAALCEELCKYLLLRLGTWRNPNFDYRFDGIVYGVCVAVGFALLENVLYVMEGGLYTALMRGVMAVPLHAFCGVFMGISYGAARKYTVMGQRGKASGSKIKALLVPMLIHGIYDFLAFMGTNGSTIILLAFVVFMYFISIKYIKKFAAEDWKASFYTDKLSDLN